MVFAMGVLNPVEDQLDSLKFNEQGLIPAIVQDHLTGEVRMMAWMNREAVAMTLSTGKATFFSRSRRKIWVKGEESGNFLNVCSLRADCDRDTLLVLCEPHGPSCHTGRDNCFFFPLTTADDGGVENDAQGFKPLLERLEQVLEQRKQSTGDKSYTRSLFDGGIAKINRKIIEEAGEVTEALNSETDERVASEAADVLFHLLVGLRHRDITWRRVLDVLAGRFGVGGHIEKASRN
jgi:phosphoribosyl-ATP pyrophosphohydrolase/phosphoribosyl-AMP cyclohydrolase